MRTSGTSRVIGMRESLAGPIMLALTTLAVCPAADPAGSAPPLQAVTREGLCVTNGVVSMLPGGRLAVDSASSRAVAQVSEGTSAQVRFRYLGPSAESKPLASGEMRRQIGIKLRAQDTCNIVYIMWHFAPDHLHRGISKTKPLDRAVVRTASHDSGPGFRLHGAGSPFWLSS